MLAVKCILQAKRLSALPAELADTVNSRGLVEKYQWAAMPIHDFIITLLSPSIQFRFEGGAIRTLREHAGISQKREFLFNLLKRQLNPHCALCHIPITGMMLGFHLHKNTIDVVFPYHYCELLQYAVAFNLDHIVPQALDGPDTLENLQLTCSQCNNKKGKSLNFTTYKYPIPILLHKQLAATNAVAAPANEGKKDIPPYQVWEIVMDWGEIIRVRISSSHPSAYKARQEATTLIPPSIRNRILVIRPAIPVEYWPPPPK